MIGVAVHPDFRMNFAAGWLFDASDRTIGFDVANRTTAFEESSGPSRKIF
jgi:hypothetical protein